MNILIINLHSSLNLGDDAIMHGTLQTIAAAYPHARVTLAANDPHSWEKFQEVEPVSSLCSWIGDCRLGHFRKKLYLMPLYGFLLLIAVVLFRLFRLRFLFGTNQKRQLLSAYFDADLVLSCGGGNFYSHHRLSPALIWNLLAVAFSIGLNKRTVLLPQSIGPIEGKQQKLIASWVFNHATHILVRESRSEKYLRNILKVTAPISLVPDLAFAIPPQSLSTLSDPTNQLRIFGSGRSPNIGVTIMDRGAQVSTFDKQKTYEQTLVNLLTKLQKRYNAHVHIFVQSYGPSRDQDDQIIATRIFEQLRKNHPNVNLICNYRDAYELRRDYKILDCIIGTRMHTAILALSAGVPCVLIGYQPKAIGIMEYLDLEHYYMDISNLDSDLLMDLVREILENHSILQESLINKYTNVHHLATQWIHLLEK